MCDMCDIGGAARPRRGAASAALAGAFLLAAACGSGEDGSPAPTGVVRLPDLTVAGDRFEPTTGFATFDPLSCEVQEACVDAPGERRLLSFSTLVWNVGAGEMYFGDPAGNPNYEFSTCHGHYHLHGFAIYQLLDATGSVVLTGHKQGFCVQDSDALPGTTAAAKYLDCANQGLTPGWGDMYAAGLPCQWIDITNLPPATYQLRVTANPEHLFEEARLDNNAATAQVVIGPP
jgi:hypothetical protein